MNYFEFHTYFTGKLFIDKKTKRRKHRYEVWEEISKKIEDYELNLMNNLTYSEFKSINPYSIIDDVRWMIEERYEIEDKPGFVNGLLLFPELYSEYYNHGDPNLVEDHKHYQKWRNRILSQKVKKK